MKKSYVVFFPNLTGNEWVSDFRREHDEKSHLVPPHITLVFPTDALSSSEMQKEVESLVGNYQKFKVRFRSAIMMPEKLGNLVVSYIFLVPDEGFGDVIRLNSLLYSNKLSKEHRLDIPFVPHMTIGSNLDLLTAKRLVDELNSRKIELEFLVDMLSVVEIDDPSKDRIIGDPILF
ncbi:MAG: 2'-5' RNA ligase family protein [Bdellovibrionaceae bacterium]|nr:2'-5' RNA ligase family protein [Pseudobdellovibrionaceae bacterium]